LATSKKLEVWVVDDDQSVRWVLEKALRQADMQTRSFERGEHLLDAIAKETPDVLITDVRMPGMDGLALLDRLSRICPELPVIVVTAHSDLENAVAAYQGGAFEYLPKPFDVDEAIELVRKAARQRGHVLTRDPADDTAKIPSLIGQAPAMQEVFRSIGRLARSSMTVLITGESGTGKELVARALHQHSPRADKPFVALNTSAIASELPTAARSFSTKSATCPLPCKPGYCGCWPKASFIASAANRRSMSTFASLPQPTRTWREPWKKAVFARTCITG
jgi:two-component system nitrogen regulation response regulator GlnG